MITQVMPEAQRHTIRLQFLEVEINGEEREGAALHRALPDLCTRLLAPAIEQVLERHAPHKGVLCIERLDIDAGNVSLKELDGKLPGLVADALERELNKMPSGYGAATPISLTDTVRLRTVTETVIEAFLFFLDNGTLPWSYKASPVLEREIAQALKAAASDGSLPASIKSALFATLRSPVARQRLVRQFSPDFILSIPDLFTAGEQQLLDSLLRECGKGQTVGHIADSRQRLLLEGALALIVSGTGLTEMSLLAALQSIPSAAGEINAEPDAAPGKIQPGESRHEAPLPPEATHTSQSPAEALPEHTTSQPESGSKDVPVGKLPDNHALPGESPDEGSGKSDHGTGDTAMTRGCDASPATNSTRTATHDEASPSKPPGETAEPGYSGEHKDSGQQNASAKPAPPGLKEQASAGLDERFSVESTLSGSAQGNNDEQSRSAGLEDAIATHMGPHGAPRPKPDPKQHDAASDTEPDRLSGKRESVTGRTLISSREHPDAKTGLYIDHAGLVLLHPFLPQFFSGLGIANDDSLVNQNRALCLLHFLATGEWNSLEYELPVMKILCGLPLEFVAEPEEPLRTEEDEEVTALLSAVIRHWDALKNTSPDGLREAFLKRPGKLSLSGGEWWLQVESKGYDILLDQLPWGISMIQLHWMPMMLRVEWFS